MSAVPGPADDRPTVGLVGLGVMGRPIGRHLLANGYDLVVVGRPPAAAAELARRGARIAPGPAELAAITEVILFALPDAAAVEAVVADLVASGSLRPGTLVVDLSTIAPSSAVRTGEALAGAGGRAIDAPMSGGESGAEAGTLSLMVGGEPTDVERVRPVLETFAGSITHVGPLGSGQIAKACTQLVVMGTLEVVAEALTLAAASGLDPGLVRDSMLGGLAGSRILEAAGRRMLDDDFAPGGRLAFHAKDIATIRGLAAGGRRSLPAFEAAAEAVMARIEHGDGDLDHAVIVRQVRGDDASDPEATITFASDATSQLHRLPGRDWTLLLGPQNSPSRRMTLSLASFPPGSGPPLHVHPIEDELVHVLSGRGRLDAERGGGRLEPGVSFHVPAGLWHGAINDGDEPLRLLCTFSPPVTPGSYDPPPAG